MISSPNFTTIYQLIGTDKIAFCRNIGLSYEVNDTRLSPFRYQSMPIGAITPIWYMVVAMVGQIVLVVVCSVQQSSEGPQKRDGVVL